MLIRYQTNYRAGVRKPRNSWRGQEKKNGNPISLTSAHLKSFTTGCMTGVALCMTALSWFNVSSDKDSTHTGQNQTASPQKHLEFNVYSALTNRKINFDVRNAAEMASSTPDSFDAYFLQVGSFRKRVDADRRRGEVTLLGFQAEILMTENNGNPRFRVQIGPLLNKSKVNEAQTLISKAGFETLVISRKDR